MPENETRLQTMEEMKLCCKALDDKKAINLKILDMRDKSSVTDYFIIVSGNSLPHLRALKNTLHKAFKASNVNVLGLEASHETGWIVIDVFDFIVHIFSEEMRENYNLEALWKDATLLETKDFID